jgi:hypothetical protein
MGHARWAAGATICLAAGVTAASWAHRDAGPAIVYRAPRAEDARAPTPGDEPRALSLAIASLTPEERAQLVERMAYATARLEARLSSLAMDFGDDEGDPVAALKREMAPRAPSFTAARAFEAGAWRFLDLAVRVARSCADARPSQDETCEPLWAAPRTTQSRRARLLAWSAVQAAVIALGSTGERANMTSALRERARHADSAIALVLTDADLALVPVPERDRLREQARLLGRAMAANRLEDDTRMEAFVAETAGERVAPWTELGATALVVVPKLSRVASDGVVVPEIEAALAETRSHARWVHRP